jgi:hypothetical protein
MKTTTYATSSTRQKGPKPPFGNALGNIRQISPAKKFESRRRKPEQLFSNGPAINPLRHCETA